MRHLIWITLFILAGCAHVDPYQQEMFDWCNRKSESIKWDTYEQCMKPHDAVCDKEATVKDKDGYENYDSAKSWACYLRWRKKCDAAEEKVDVTEWMKNCAGQKI